MNLQNAPITKDDFRVVVRILGEIAPIAQAVVDSGRRVTHLRQDIVPDERFLDSPDNPLWESANVGLLILSLHPIKGDGTAVIASSRPVSAHRFAPRDARIARFRSGDGIDRSRTPPEITRPNISIPNASR